MFLFSYNDWCGTKVLPSCDWLKTFLYEDPKDECNYPSECLTYESRSKRFQIIDIIKIIYLIYTPITQNERYWVLTGWLLYCASRSSISRFLSFFAWSHNASHATTSMILYTWSVMICSSSHFKSFVSPLCLDWFSYNT